MAQHDYNIANQGFPAFRTDLNNALSAIQTTNSGTSRPTGAVAGQLWLDTTSATTPTLKYYDGADDISLATIDHSANTVNWLDSTVSITGLSTTATGTVLTLSDSVNTTTVNLIIDNQKEIRFRETTANGTNYVALKAPASLSADLTFTLPATDGTSGQVLQTNGSGVLSFVTVGGLAWQSVQTTGFTAVAGRGYPLNTTSSAFTVTLPATPSVGDTIVLVDYAGTFATNNITLGANSNNINGAVINKLLTTNREAVTITYVDSTQGWVATSGVNEGTVALTPPPYSVDFLVIAGGGGGGRCTIVAAPAGGGGAGGYRNSFGSETSGGGGTSETELTFSSGTVYTITVGAGGAGNGLNSGTSSSISGTGISTITSTGGGYGGGNNGSVYGAATGGSGGGSAGGGNNAAAGTANQGFAGGANTDSAGAGGGGGGAGAVGVNGVGTTGGNGGAGLASSITGSSVTRAGGGGGSGDVGTIGSGGTGGGGDGGGGTEPPTLEPTNATANTGGGGGGALRGGAGGVNGSNGGSGVVILSMPDASYSGTTTGSPTVATGVSGKTVLVFNASGTYTG
jgi:hypothetical protein